MYWNCKCVTVCYTGNLFRGVKTLFADPVDFFIGEHICVYGSNVLADDVETCAQKTAQKCRYTTYEVDIVHLKSRIRYYTRIFHRKISSHNVRTDHTCEVSHGSRVRNFWSYTYTSWDSRRSTTRLWAENRSESLARKMKFVAKEKKLGCLRYEARCCGALISRRHGLSSLRNAQTIEPTTARLARLTWKITQSARAEQVSYHLVILTSGAFHIETRHILNNFDIFDI